jgi:hypothetical protein
MQKPLSSDEVVDFTQEIIAISEDLLELLKDMNPQIEGKILSADPIEQN